MNPSGQNVADLTSILILVGIFFYVRSERGLYDKTRLKRFTLIVAFSALYPALRSALHFLEGWADFSMTARSLQYVLTQAVFCLILDFIIVDADHMTGDAGPGNRLIRILSSAFVPLSVLMCVLNAASGLFFRTSGGVIIRGPLARLFALLMLIDASLVAVHIYLRRTTLQPQAKRMIGYLPAFVLVLIVIQLIFPDLWLSTVLFTVLVFFCFLNLTSASFLTDSVTGLGNIKLLTSSLDYYLARSKQFSVVKVDLVNWRSLQRDLEAHDIDRLMVRLTSRFLSVDGVDNAFRMGEDDFALIIPPPADNKCRKVCTDLARIFSEDYMVCGATVNILARLILVPCPVIAQNTSAVYDILSFFSQGTVDPSSLPQDAYYFNDTNFTFLVCDLRLVELVRRRQHIVRLVATASARGLFEVEFQPLCDTEGNFCNRAECLVRLPDGKGGRQISPEEFIPIAEAEGYMDMISGFVLRQSCEIIRDCRRAGLVEPVISVNFSTRQFYSRDLVSRTSDILESYGVRPENIKLEMTEDSLIDNYEMAQSVMDGFRKRGIGFYLDDFGAGYASLPRYLNLPFECVKIDRSFVQSSFQSRRNDLFLRSIVPCFRSLGCQIIFEGVENESLFSYARSFGSDIMIQGYCYSQPLDREKFRKKIGLDGAIQASIV